MSLLINLQTCFNQAYQDVLPLGSDSHNYQDLRDSIVDGIIDAFKEFIVSSQWQTVYSGNTSIGVVAATVQSVSTSISLDETSFKSQLSDVIDDMTESGGSTTDQWADALTDIFVNMCASAQVFQVLSGTAVPPVPPPPTVPFAGNASGFIQLSSSVLFSPMRVLTALVDGSNDTYASDLSALLKSAISSAIISMASDAPLTGLSGAGINTFND